MDIEIIQNYDRGKTEETERKAEANIFIKWQKVAEESIDVNHKGGIR